jgi:ribose transport system substrate-binding protein
MAKEPEVAEAVVRACSVLRAFRPEDTELTLRHLVDRTGLSKTTCFRLIQSLVKGGLVERVGKGSYRSRIAILASASIRIGYASQKSDSEFSQEVTRSIHRAAAREHIQLVEVDNQYSAKAALRNADLLIQEGVKLVLEFQTFENVAPILSSKFVEADIPVIAIEIPHPGAVFFGADNYQAGVIGGRALGQWAKRQWNGDVEAVLLLELPIAGPLPQLRVTGMVAGLSAALPGIATRTMVHLDGKGEFEHSFEVVRRYLSRTHPNRTLIAAVNDPSALGALRAFEEAGRGHLCAVMGQNAIRAARNELRRPGTRLIGSVGYFPELYGEELIPLALSMLQKKTVPSAVFVKHQLITPKNVGLIYPIETD